MADRENADNSVYSLAHLLSSALRWLELRPPEPAAEAAALAAGKTLLVLDTASGDAERPYARSGGTRVGVVPDFALRPDSRSCDTTFFFKRLRRG